MHSTIDLQTLTLRQFIHVVGVQEAYMPLLLRHVATTLHKDCTGLGGNCTCSPLIHASDEECKEELFQAT